ncbi:MAG: hypothetical protein RSE93_04790 [Oscillospiraceae bacterium]
MDLYFIIPFCIVRIIRSFSKKDIGMKYQIYSSIVFFITACLNVFVVQHFNLAEQILLFPNNFALNLLFKIIILDLPTWVVAFLIEFKFKIDKWIYCDKLDVTSTEIKEDKDDLILQRGNLD